MRKILVIDDQKDNITTISAVIKSNIPDCKILKAISGKEGINIATKEQPDAILLDIIMPEMDGYEVCQKLKENKETKHIPIILVTAIKTDTESRVKGLNLGADAFLSKPIDAIELSAQINVMLRIKAAEDQLREDKAALEETVLNRTHELKESEEKYKALYENAPLPYQSLNEDGSFRDINPAWLETLGYDRKEVIGKFYKDFLHPDWQAHFEKNFPAFKKRGYVSDVQFKIRHKKGNYLDISFEGCIGYHPDGSFKQTYCVFKDITEQKKVEQSLLESEEMFRSLIKNSSDLVFLTDAEGKVNYISPQCNDIIGHSPEGLMGVGFPDFIHPDDLERTMKKWETVYKHKKDIREIEYRIFDNKGQIQWLSHSTKTIIFNGEIKVVQNSIRNITNQKLAENELQKSEERYQSFINHSQEGIYRMEMEKPLDISLPVEEQIAIINQHAYYAECNGAFLKMYGVKTSSEILNKNRFDFNKNNETSNENVRNFITSGYQIFNAESCEEINKKELKWFSNNTIGIVEDGFLVRMWGTQLDITKRKQIENALKENESEMRAVFEAAEDVAFITTDIKGKNSKILSFSKGAEKIFGYKSSEVIGQKVSILHHEKDVDDFDKKQSILEGQLSDKTELSLIRKSGKSFSAIFSHHALYDKNGQINRTLGVTIDISERKKIEQELSDSRDEYESLFNQIADPVAVFDQETKMFLHCNLAMIEKYGFSLDEFKEMTPLSLHPSDSDTEIILKNIDDIEKASPNEYLHQAKDGTIFQVETHTQDIVYEGHKSWITIIRDITERKKAEKASLESAEKYRVLYTSTNDAIFLIQDYKFISCNPRTLKMYGCKREDIIGHAPIEFSPEIQPNGRPSVRLALKKIDLALSGKPQIFEWLHHKKDGTPFNAEITLTKMQLSDGDYIHAIVRDITERKRSDLIQKALYNISNAVITTDSLESFIEIIQNELGGIIDTTNFFIAFYNKNDDTFFSPFFSDEKDDFNTWPAGKTMSSYVVKTGKPLLISEDELLKMHTEGKVKILGAIPKSGMVVPLTHKGKTTGVFAVQSYTDKNAYDNEDLEMLEFVSDQISLSIHRKNAEQNLKDALKKATESDRLKSTFLATMSHELRTPLNAIIGFSDIIDKSLPIDEIVKFTKTINDSGNHLLNIVEDLFDITLIESGQIKIIKEEFQLMPILNNVHEIIEAEQKNTNKENITLKLILPKNINEINLNTDRSKFKQILINLLKNAIKFTSSGQISYGFNFESKSEKPYLKFFVQDTGIGIREDQQELIFDMFRQADETYSTAHGGTGIGLSITKKLTELLGGTIWLESKVGQGSTFFFTIPLETAIEVQANASSEPTNQHDLSSKTILIAEDIEASYLLLEAMLSKTNMNFLWAKNGEEAVTICKENKQIDLVLMDINMPILNGYDATIAIKQFRPELPIIAQTAYAIIGDREKSIEAGCDDYISKPIKKQTLLKIIKKYIT